MPTLGLCVIAKNAAAMLPKCLESVKCLVNAVILVGTGSADETRTIAEQCGAAVLSFPWNNDFAAARNAALNAIDTDWMLVLDADEELDAQAHSWIRRELKAPRADGYVVPVRNYLAPWNEQLPDQIMVPVAERHAHARNAVVYLYSGVCRLYRRSPDIHYKGHVHEQVEYCLMELGRPILRADFHIHHFGWYLIDAEGLRRKCTFYGELLAEKLRKRPDDPQVMVQYGDSLSTWQGKPREGLEWFMRAAQLASLEMEHGNAEKGISLLRAAAAQAEREAEGNPHTATTLRAAMLNARLQRWERVLDLIQGGLARTRTRSRCWTCGSRPLWRSSGWTRRRWWRHGLQSWLLHRVPF